MPTRSLGAYASLTTFWIVQLSALTAKSDLVAAVLYKSDGEVFAHYYRAGSPAPELPPPIQGKDLARVSGGHIEVFSDVSLRGERLGTLFLQSDLQRWSTRASSSTRSRDGSTGPRGIPGSVLPARTGTARRIGGT